MLEDVLILFLLRLFRLFRRLRRRRILRFRRGRVRHLRRRLFGRFLRRLRRGLRCRLFSRLRRRRFGRFRSGFWGGLRRRRLCRIRLLFFLPVLFSAFLPVKSLFKEFLFFRERGGKDPRDAHGELEAEQKRQRADPHANTAHRHRTSLARLWNAVGIPVVPLRIVPHSAASVNPSRRPLFSRTFARKKRKRRALRKDAARAAASSCV